MTADQGGPVRPAGAQGARRRLRLPLPASWHAVRLARRATRDALAAWRLARVEETAVLLVSELVTNAVRHARGAGAILELEAAGTWLRIEVHDTDPRPPRPRILAEAAESGFGLVLVDGLASRWGVRQTATGKAVWAELDARQGGEPPRKEPMHPPVPFPGPVPAGRPRAAPGHVAAALAAQLARLGLTRTYVAACELLAVISVAAGLTVWTNGQALWWDYQGQRRIWPAVDTNAAAAHLAALARRAG